EEFDTVGGLILKQLGHLPERGETIQVDNMLFKVLRSDNRRIHLLELTLLPES
ncbi:MAG: magnesium/cobalt efflux protein, partial [Gammaproteobacteria bacterium]|nr:magnesium/cobalt efflux protein [Gammaproteobacteria bacterium]